MSWPFCGSRMANCRQWHPGKRVVYLMYWDVVTVAIQLKARNNGDIWKVTCSQLVVCQTCSRTPQEPSRTPWKFLVRRSWRGKRRSCCSWGANRDGITICWDSKVTGCAWGRQKALSASCENGSVPLGPKMLGWTRLSAHIPTGRRAGFLSSPDWLPKSFIPNHAQTTIIALKKIEHASLNPQTISVQTKK